MSESFRENLVWLGFIPLTISLVAVIVSLVLVRRWGTPNPFEQKMRHLSKIDKQKALLASYEVVNQNLDAFLFVHIREFLREIFVGCSITVLPILTMGVYMFYFVAIEIPKKPPTAQQSAETLEVVVRLFGLTYLLFALIAAYIGSFAFLRFRVMRRIQRFEKYEKPEILKRIEELERVKD